MEINIVKFIQSFGNEFLNNFFSIISELGNKYFFIIITLVVYWCYNKKFAFKFMFIYLSGVVFNSCLKIVINRPRPYTSSNEIINLEPENTGTSMPSSHAFGISLIGSQIYKQYYLEAQSHTKLKKFKGLLLTTITILITLVCFSRIYLGQHYLSDVLVGTFSGVLFSVFASKLYKVVGDKEEFYGLIVIPLTIIACGVAYKQLFIYSQTYTLFYTIAGTLSATMLGYYLEKHFIKYEPKTTFVFTLLKIIFGFISTIVLLLILEMLLPPILILVYIKYFIVGLWAFAGVMKMFKLFSLHFNKTCYKTFSAHGTEKLGTRLGKKLKAGDVVLLIGELGAGKTAITKGIAKALKVTENVVSPTFTIMNEYADGAIPLYHFDMYRISNVDEIQETGLIEYLNSDRGICVIEWPQNISPILPKKSIIVKLDKTKNPNERIIKIEGLKI
ncbi:MAG: tRNA (adenosine(37)-N6)-threonylcarbamoyltransferase complex ATPase subunit type 1 TsaE [Clostridia bacterium]